MSVSRLVALTGVFLFAQAAHAVEPDALSVVNAQRAARGLPPFQPDPALTAAAEAAASFRAQHGLFGHTSNDFAFLPPGASCTAAGCAAYPAEYGFMACCTYENHTHAGAASVRGRDGRVYHHLFVSNHGASFGPLGAIAAPNAFRTASTSRTTVFAAGGRLSVRERFRVRGR